MNAHRSIRTTLGALTLAAALAAPPVAMGASQDLRSPDARDAGRPAALTQDLRSPDARDAGEPARPTVVLDAPPVRVVHITPGGFEWGDAAVGAAATLGALFVLAGAMAAWTRRRHAAYS